MGLHGREDKAHSINAIVNSRQEARPGVWRAAFIVSCNHLSRIAVNLREAFDPTLRMAGRNPCRVMPVASDGPACPRNDSLRLAEREKRK